ncbi:MAG: hypothetical protein M3Z26_10920 [Bacteroidota bacterium]|nr:hypothetical protein [Bacteroidota bacterium]
MKKFLVSLLAIFVLSLIGIYAFIPQKLEISKIGYVKCNGKGAFRIISDANAWKKWWPKTSVSSDLVENSFFYNGYYFQPSIKFTNAAEVTINNNSFSIKSRINLIELNRDSVVLIWKSQLPTGYNPLIKISKYQQAEKIKNNMTAILSALQLFLEKSENIYGAYFHIIMSKDSTMVATKGVTRNYPTTDFIYGLIGNLKKYIAGEDAKENNFPMLHIKKLSDSTYETMVAIPVNKELQGKDKIFFSRFVPWKVLTAEVEGGNYTVDEALRQMKMYISDYQKSAMAIPFESLVTDRNKEPDTTKWVTRIYTPVPE